MGILKSTKSLYNFKMFISLLHNQIVINNHNWAFGNILTHTLSNR